MHTKYIILAAALFMTAACIGPKVDVPPPPPGTENLPAPNLVPPSDTRRNKPLTPAERRRVEDGLASQAVTPAPPPAR